MSHREALPAFWSYAPSPARDFFTSHLRHQEAGIGKEESGMRAQDNGELTGQHKKTLNQQQNKKSKRIYRDKHNARKR